MFPKQRSVASFSKNVVRPLITNQCSNAVGFASLSKIQSKIPVVVGRQHASMHQNLSFDFRNDVDAFDAAYPKFVDEMVKYTRTYGTEAAAKHLKEALDYSLPNGQKVRGLITFNIHKQLIGADNLTAQDIRDGATLGWIIELLHTAGLVLDDIADGSEVRRGKTCWYRLDHVGLLSMIDGITMANHAYPLLRNHFGHLPCYVDLLELFHTTIVISSIGASADCLVGLEDISNFSNEFYKRIANSKTSHFGFYTTIAAPLILNGYSPKDNKMLFDQIENIWFGMGHLYQVRNDMQDLFSESGLLKISGTDIEEKRCTWLAVMALEMATEQQKIILGEGLGSRDPVKVDRVKQLYVELELPKLYKQHEEETFNRIERSISEVEIDAVKNALVGIASRFFYQK